MSQAYNVSICLTDLINLAKKNPVHSAFNRAKNLKAYVAMTIWINDEPDKYDNDISVQLHSVKGKSKTEGKVYIGNGRTNISGKRGPRPQPNNDVPADDLPF